MCTRILIADDHPAVRRTLAQLLGNEPDLEVIGEAKDGIEAVRLTIKYRPDVVIMDVVMPELNGIEATRQIVQQCPRTRVIGLSVHESRIYARQMLDAGAAAYILKDGETAALLAAIRSVFGDANRLGPSATNAVA